jgi:hypothetical protein
MKTRLALVDEILTGVGISRDVVTYKILPMVKEMETERNMRVKYMQNSTFRFFIPKQLALGTALNRAHTPLVTIVRYDPPHQVTTPDGTRHVGKKSHMLQWNPETNEVIPGQWITNKKMLKNCDLSSDGKYFLYGLKVKGQGMSIVDRKPIVVLSKPPYFSGLFVMHDFTDTTGYDIYYDSRLGGIFLDDKNHHTFTLPNYKFFRSTGELPPGNTIVNSPVI